MSQTDSIISYERVDDVAVITMDDGKANALSYALLAELDEALTRAEQEASAIVLAGRAQRFSAGFDLKVMMQGPESARDLMTRGGDVMMRLYGCPLPTVAACTGHALAGGALLLLCCDLRIGAEGAFKLGLNEVAIGLPVPHLAYRLAQDRLERRRRYEATLMATIFDPAGAAAVGFLDRTVAEEEVLATARAEAARLGALPSFAYAHTKRSMRGPIITEIREALAEDLKKLHDLAQGGG
ncbi:MAG: crotonase/enoyl-CoA hydratase family protein [Myxococcales bacterium]|nr:crotonase/enoyl-CoA hydratase family protein [Myxococcales bacterium]